MSETKTPEQMAEDFASEKIGKSWQLGKGSAWLPAITTEQRFDQCVHAFLAGYEAARPKWISVKERLPECRVPVLCWATDYAVVLQRDEFRPGRYNWILDNDTRLVADAIKYWMPLLELKEGEK